MNQPANIDSLHMTDQPSSNVALSSPLQTDGQARSDKRSLKLLIGGAAQEQILNALSASNDGTSLQRIISILSAIGQQVPVSTLFPRELHWLGEVRSLQTRIDAFVRSDSTNPIRVSLCAPIRDQQLPGFCHTLAAISGIPPTPARIAIDRLLIAVVVTASGNNMTIGDTVANGFRQIYKAFESRANNKWLDLATNPPSTIEAVDSMLLVNRVGVVNTFLQEIRTFISLEIPAPEQRRENDELVMPDHSSSEANNYQTEIKFKSGSTWKQKSTLVEETEETQEPSAPSIRAMVRTAQLMNISRKAGIAYHWDFLSLKNFMNSTHRLAGVVEESSITRCAYATMALASIQVRSNAKSALLTPTHWAPVSNRGDIWINVEQKNVTWLHNAYASEIRSQGISINSLENLENHVPFTSSLGRGLDRLTAISGPRDNLNEIVLAATGLTNVDLKEYNNFLKSIGDPAHLSEPTRFAQSLAPAILEITGSDLLAAFAGLGFELSAPSALFYFSPSRRWINDMCSSVFSKLGV